MITATISSGHTDLADLLFLLAFILMVVATAFAVVVKPLNLGRIATLAAGALFALAWFVL